MRRAQANTLDLLLAILIVTVGAVLLNSVYLPQSQTPKTYTDAQAAAEAMFSAYPQDWNSSTVIVPGIVSNHQLKESLFAQAKNLSSLSARIGIESELFINTTIGTIGTYPNASSTQISRVTRYAAYNGTITPIEVIVWQE